ncbi:MAG TPA: TetR/AcrR family transcriptional regulator [Bacteroidales bacterium]|nr:TetR/AcrR family transcriptional regulator [Bacteroidales bacterium]HRZ76210.1 TetR/AcrR family transcriptional regulator [Bacteroidales bacterium]
MNERDKGTEEKIVQAARAVFLRKGYNGARMQEIADEAGTNKALLHYYFRSKDRLFEVIFLQSFSQFFPKVSTILTGNEPLPVKVVSFVEHYIDLLRENPYLPQFILSEVSRDPESVPRLFQAAGLNPEWFMGQLANIGQGVFPPGSDVRHFILNMLSMCIFPFAARPLLTRVMFSGDDAAYENFLDQRKREVSSACLQLLSPTAGQR